MIETKAQTNPHDDVNYDCETCHQTSDWWTIEFNHDTTGFLQYGR